MSSLKKQRRLQPFLRQLWPAEEGENIVEYGLILSIISLAVVAAAVQLGLSFEALWQGVYNALAGAMDIL